MESLVTTWIICTLKDIIDTADKMQTTVGSLALKAHIAKYDAHIVKRLRESGAIILQTNLSEWANFRSTSLCSGWSSRGGQTVTLYFRSQSSCGSSAGSGCCCFSQFVQ
jgi:amidase